MQQLILHPCNKPSVSIAANLLAMEGIAEDHQFVKSLIDWAENGVVSRAARNIGVSPSTLNRHYNGTAETRLGRDTLAKLYEHYPNFPDWGSRNFTVRSEVGRFGDRPFDEKYSSGELPVIPVVGSTIGVRSFDPERDIELTELDMSEVLGGTERPSSLASDSAAYALTVIGDSMAPKFEPGSRIIVSPRAAVLVNDYVVVQLKGPDPEDQYEERITTVLIKRLVRRSASFIELHQFNPKETFRVDQSRVAAVHKVIGEVY